MQCKNFYQEFFNLELMETRRLAAFEIGLD